MLHTEDFTEVEGMWFGNRDADSMFPGIVGVCCCGLFWNGCCTKKVGIRPSWVSLYLVEPSTMMTR